MQVSTRRCVSAAARPRAAVRRAAACRWGAQRISCDPGQRLGLGCAQVANALFGRVTQAGFDEPIKRIIPLRHFAGLTQIFETHDLLSHHPAYTTTPHTRSCASWTRA